MARLSGFLFIVFTLLAILAFTQRNNFPEAPTNNISIPEPLQSRSLDTPFTVEYEENSYQITPVMDYEMDGLVVSYQHHSGEAMLHKSWSDHLNSADVCIIWGKNIDNPYLNKIDFWNGQFTCNVKTGHQNAWDNFDIYALSNNHLITENTWLREKIRSVRIGDHIKVRGMLSNYSTNGRPPRKSSLTRKDTGDGACETIYVQDFTIIRSMSSPWRLVFYISLFMSILSLALYIYSPHTAR
ncbi:MAG: hypothetical protein ACI93R_003280 [Flavobacteriales bacterium]|jgi:hypothetical protein